MRSINQKMKAADHIDPPLFIDGARYLRLRFDHDHTLHSGVDVTQVFIHAGFVKFQAASGRPLLAASPVHVEPPAYFVFNRVGNQT
ncbi:MAG: hypothetical protein ABI690_00300 [Chloroflexota bacterium]